MLDIIDVFSKFAYGRHSLNENGALYALRNAIREVQETIDKTLTLVTGKGLSASPISANDASLLSLNINTLCQVFVRTALAKDQAALNKSVNDDHSFFMDVIDDLIGLLRFDLATAINSFTTSAELSKTTGGTAANSAAVNTAALVALLPFNVEQCTVVISCLGRMVEFNERWKARAKANGLLPLLLDCFKIQEALQLHQVADKLLHLCIHVGDHSNVAKSVQDDISEDQHEHRADSTTQIDPHIICAVSTTTETNPVSNVGSETAAQSCHMELKPPLVALDTLLSMLEVSNESVNKMAKFRLLRWIAALVDLPENANALGERGISILLQLAASTSVKPNLLLAYLAKSIHAIVLQSPTALELCGRHDNELLSAFFDLLQQSSKTEEDPQAFIDRAGTGERKRHSNEISDWPDQIEDISNLKWIDDTEEGSTFEPHLTPISVHNIDALLAVSEALTALAKAFQKWNLTDRAPMAIDFSEAANSISFDKSGAPSTGESKKKMTASREKLSIVGEALMLGLLRRGLQVLSLISHYTAVDAAVCVSLLGLLDTLLTIPSGMKVLLQLARNELQSPACKDPIATSHSTMTVAHWPFSVDLARQMEHSFLLVPVLNVLQSPSTSFFEIEAAVRSIAVLTSDQEATMAEPTQKVLKSPNKGEGTNAGVNPCPPLVITDSDRFINAGLGHGMVVVLLAFMDVARLPKAPRDFSNRANLLKAQIDELVQKCIRLGQVKQANMEVKYRETLTIEEQSPGNSEALRSLAIDLSLSYKAQWAQLLDVTFHVPRFGYTSYSAMLLASELGLSHLVSMLLDAGASSETTSVDGFTPLMAAFLVGKEDSVIDLLEARANIDAVTTDNHGLTVWNCALVSPVKVQVNEMVTRTYTNAESLEGVRAMSARIELDSIGGSLQYLDMCLHANVDVNVSSFQGDFLLHALLSQSIVRRKLRGVDLCFRYKSHFEDLRRLEKAVIDLIQHHSANVNSCNRMGQTPLHLALLYGHTTTVKILLQCGANPNVQCIHGHLPLHYACLGFCGSFDGSDGDAIEILKLLLAQATKYTSVLGVYEDCRKHKSVEEKHALAIDQILENGLLSLVHPKSIVCKLADCQEILTTTSFHGKFLPWHFACGACVQLSSIFCLDDALQHWFHANGQARAGILSYLIREWNIDVSTTANDNLNALHLACKSDVHSNNVPVIDVLLQHCRPQDFDVNAVHDCILIDPLPVISCGAQALFLETSGEPNRAYVSSRSYDNKYHLILEDGRHVENVAREQLQAVYDSAIEGAQDPNEYKYRVPMESRFAALHYALQSNHDTLALRLLALPAISLVLEGSDLPLLALACAAGQSPEVVRRLITQEANMRVHLPLRTCKLAVDSETTMTEPKHAAALHYAVMYEDVAMVDTLLSSTHVLPNVQRSEDGFTPLHLACEQKNLKLVKLLLDHGASLTQVSSKAATCVSPLHLLIKSDTINNDFLNELISENYVRPEMLLTGYATDITAGTSLVKDGCNQRSDGNAIVTNDNDIQTNDGRKRDVSSCVLLQEEQHNLDLFERLHGVDQENQCVRMEFEKSDGLLCAFFNLLRKSFEASEPHDEVDTESQSLRSSLLHVFEHLPHCHECYRQLSTRSQWKEKSETPRTSKAVIDEIAAEPAWSSSKELQANSQ